MKRSGDVTASAIILFFGSGLMVLMAVVIIAGAAVTPLPPEQRVVEFVVPIFYALLAAWGIATGVGTLQLRPWARISMIVMSGLAIFSTVSGAVGLMAVPMLLRQEPNMPAGAIRIVLFVALITMAVPLAIAIWWLVLFTRARVRAEFATHAAATVSSANTSAANAPEFVPAVVVTPSMPEIPISIRVVAIIFLVFGGFTLLWVPFAIRTNMPNIVLGILIQDQIAWAYGVGFALAQIGLCLAVLKRRAWALDGFIAFTLFAATNSVLFAISPSRKVFVDTIMQTEKFPPGGVDASTMASFMNNMLPISMAFGVLLSAVVLYFLFTRRKAFRLACGAQAAAD